MGAVRTIARLVLGSFLVLAGVGHLTFARVAFRAQVPAGCPWTPTPSSSPPVSFGLDSDTARAVRLLFQPLLVVWALWCTGAWRAALARWADARDQHHR